jgi:Putative transmembrane protein (PGPGW)
MKLPIPRTGFSLDPNPEPPITTPPPRNSILRLGRVVGVAIAGGAVTAAGVAMLVLPGPGILTIVLGLGILSLEFERPRVWLAQIKARAVDVKRKFEKKPPAQ